MTSSLRDGIIPIGLQIIPSSRCGAVVAASISSSPSTFADLRVELERDRTLAGGQVTADLEHVSLQTYRVGAKPHLRVVVGIEEIRRTQVLIAPAVAGLHTAASIVSSIAGSEPRSSRPWYSSKWPLTVPDPTRARRGTRRSSAAGQAAICR